MSKKPIRFPVMLDSGAYSAWRAGKAVDFKEYMAYLKYLIQRFPGADFEYVNLDVIGDGKASYRNWRTMRDEGLNPMPVWHLTTAHTWLEKYLKLTNRVALSWFGAMPFKRRILSLDHIWSRYILGPDGAPTVNVHGMGVADFRILLRYPWATIDSTSWLLTAAMGDVYVPDVVDGGWSFGVKPSRVTVSGPVLRWGHGDKVGLRVSCHEQKIIEAYFTDIGHHLEGEGGMRNHWKPRRLANMRFMWEYIRRLALPRRFLGKTPEVLWDSVESKPPERGALTSTLFGFDHTVMYLAGNIEWEGTEHFLKTRDKLPGLGRLASYWYTNTPVSKAKVLENLFEALENEKGRA